MHLTVHIVVACSLVVIRHRQEQASWVGLGQRPVFVTRPILVDDRCWYAAIFINDDERLAVSSLLSASVSRARPEVWLCE